MEFKPEKALYIKLGEKGKWEDECIEQNVLMVGYREVPHELYSSGRWGDVKKKFKDHYENKKSLASRLTNEIRSFYEEGEDTLWITFSKGRMWWCFSKPEISLRPDGLKTRPVIGKWKSTDLKGNTLDQNYLSGNLTKTASFRGTICNVEDFGYLVRKIRGDKDPDVDVTNKAKEELEKHIETLVKKLHYKDFEVLIDNIFSKAGLERISVLGETQKDLDLDVISLLTGDRYGIQIKSGADLSDYRRYEGKFSEMKGFRRFYFVVHTPKKDLSGYANESGKKDVEIWLPTKIAQMTIRYGLVDWVINKTQ